MRGRRSIRYGENGSNVDGEIVLREVVDIAFQDGAYDKEREFVPRNIVVSK